MQFSFFPRLPVELQRLIWSFCLPSRVIEIYEPEHDDMLDEYEHVPDEGGFMLDEHGHIIDQHNGMLGNRDGMLDNHEDILDNHGSSPWLTICTLNRTTWLNTRPPLICRVCRLSRSVAFAAGVFVAPISSPEWVFQP